MIAFILVECSMGHEHEVFNLLLNRKIKKRRFFKKKNLDEFIVEVHPLFGKYDLILKIEAKKIKELEAKIFQIRAIEGVVDTETLTGTRF